MTYLGWVFVYTPFPWLAAMYVLAYRHDLARLAEPFRDQGDLRAWWPVCRHLGLIEGGTPRPARRVWRSKPLLALLALTFIDLIAPTILAPFGWYYLAACQIASALGLFIILVSRIGPIPSRPYADTLRYPRLGTRARHLGKERETSRNPVGTTVKGGA